MIIDALVFPYKILLKHINIFVSVHVIQMPLKYEFFECISLTLPSYKVRDECKVRHNSCVILLLGRW